MEIDFRQVAAITERAIPDGGDAGGDCNIGQTGAVERTPSDDGDVSGDCNIDQIGAGPERITPKNGNTVANQSVSQVGAGGEYPVPDIGDTGRNFNSGQTGSVECVVPNAGDAVGNYYTGQACAERKRIASNAGNDFTVYVGRNGNCSAAASIFSYGERVVIGCVRIISSQTRGDK